MHPPLHEVPNRGSPHLGFFDKLFPSAGGLPQRARQDAGESNRSNYDALHEKESCFYAPDARVALTERRSCN